MESLSDTAPGRPYRIVSFASEHASAFKALNLNWIRQHWEPEAADFKVLDHPQTQILDKGGYIAIALMDTAVVGTCALIKINNSNYELAKMAVADAAQGHGIGRALGEAVLQQAKALGANRVFLESNTVLQPALALYRNLGFAEFNGPDSPYNRCNVQMEIFV